MPNHDNNCAPPVFQEFDPFIDRSFEVFIPKELIPNIMKPQKQKEEIVSREIMEGLKAYALSDTIKAVVIPPNSKQAEEYNSTEARINQRFTSKLAPNVGKLLECPVCHKLMRKREIKRYNSEPVWKYGCLNRSCPRFNIF